MLRHPEAVLYICHMFQSFEHVDKADAVFMDAAAGHAVQPHHVCRGLLRAVVLPALIQWLVHSAAVRTGQLWLKRAGVHGECKWLHSMLLQT
jgi:hypothetical protein